jgi:hypothetical protein
VKPHRDALCTIEGCNKPHAALGYCGMHWARQSRHGSTAIAQTYVNTRSRPGPNVGLWSRENLAWAAGIIEGEGCFKRSHRTTLRISVNMTDKDILDRLQMMLGGAVSGPHRYEPRRKPIWCWNLCGALPCYAVIAALLPWFGKRRRSQASACVHHFLGGVS